MAAIALFAQPGDAGSAGTGTEAEGQAEVSVHPVSPLAPATLVPFGLLMGSRSCRECCKTAQPLLHIPSSRDAPAIMVCPHGIACARLSSSLGLEGVSPAGCLAVQRPQPLSSALGGGQQGGCVMGRVVPSAEDGRKHPVSYRITVASLGGRKKVPKAAG